MISVLLLAFAVSLAATLWLRRWARARAVPYPQDAPQRFHRGETPRVGGLGMLAGWALALLALPLLQRVGMAGNISVQRLDLPAWLLVLAPAVAGGALEDLTQRLSVRWRLLLTFASGALAAWALGLAVPSLGFGWLDAAWRQSAWPAVALAVLAVAGLPHAFNIIDGYNGLAASVAAVVCLALAHVAMQVGDRELATAALALAAATGGFLVWNYPRGLVFAGDAGAYLWGVLVAAISVLLVQRNAAVSPWFPMLLLMYPVWETLFSIYRKLRRGGSPAQADALHLHQLVYRRLISRVLHEDEAKNMLRRNNRTTPYLLGFVAFTVAPALLFWHSGAALALCCALFAASYVLAYVRLVRFKVPKILQPPR